MSNTFLTPSIIAKESAIELVNNLVAGNLVYKGYSPEFAKVGDTITVRKPASFTAQDFNEENGIQVQNATETGITLTLDKFVDVSFAITSKDLSLSLNEFSERLIKPAMRAIYQRIDSDILAVAPQFPAFHQRGASAAIGDFAQMGKILNENKVPMDSRNAVLGASHFADYLSLPNITEVAAAGTTAGLREAALGRVLGFDTYMDQNIGDLPENTTTTGNATGTKGDAYWTVATSADVPVGSLFKVAGDTTVYTVTKTDLTNKRIYVAGGVQKTISTEGGAGVTFVSGKASSLFFHKNAIALVSAPLETLGNVNTASVTWKGITIRVTQAYDINYKKDIISIDCLYGVKPIDINLGARLISA